MRVTLPVVLTTIPTLTGAMFTLDGVPVGDPDVATDCGRV
nr:hypothetical protein CPGR_03855 [Mycolicibacterium malmesburyense]